MEEVDLGDLIRNLPAGFYLLRDVAYPLSEQLLIPFSGLSRQTPANNIFNYYLLQLWIQIEMSLGLLTTKFRIFCSPMECSLETVSKVVVVTVCLHNFIIDVQRPDIDTETNNIDQYEGVDGLTTKEEESGFVPGEPDEFSTDPLLSLSGSSLLRESVRNWVAQKGLQQPDHNLSCWEREEENS